LNVHVSESAGGLAPPKSRMLGPPELVPESPLLPLAPLVPLLPLAPLLLAPLVPLVPLLLAPLVPLEAPEVPELPVLPLDAAPPSGAVPSVDELLLQAAQKRREVAAKTQTWDRCFTAGTLTAPRADVNLDSRGNRVS
jgi:hypothetical protein